MYTKVSLMEESRISFGEFTLFRVEMNWEVFLRQNCLQSHVGQRVGKKDSENLLEFFLVRNQKGPTAMWVAALGCRRFSFSKHCFLS